ncbi:unnamed protein product [Protopolystoma xenopodis]|uniref:Uncharacterized protein n=1 Tax=Protopolystoma xenopodis TaxID=117903 RepID=A0A448XME1_9PLAT|nr:unnamed protein product [Protopolystoma xenopodis]
MSDHPKQFYSTSSWISRAGVTLAYTPEDTLKSFIVPLSGDASIAENHKHAAHIDNSHREEQLSNLPTSIDPYSLEYQSKIPFHPNRPGEQFSSITELKSDADKLFFNSNQSAKTHLQSKYSSTGIAPDLDASLAESTDLEEFELLEQYAESGSFSGNNLSKSLRSDVEHTDLRQYLSSKLFKDQNSNSPIYYQDSISGSDSFPKLAMGVNAFILPTPEHDASNNASTIIPPNEDLLDLKGDQVCIIQPTLTHKSFSPTMSQEASLSPDPLSAEPTSLKIHDENSVSVPVSVQPKRKVARLLSHKDNESILSQSTVKWPEPELAIHHWPIITQHKLRSQSENQTKLGVADATSQCLFPRLMCRSTGLTKSIEEKSQTEESVWDRPEKTNSLPQARSNPTEQATTTVEPVAQKQTDPSNSLIFYMVALIF